MIERWKEAQDTTLAKLTIQGGEVRCRIRSLEGFNTTFMGDRRRLSLCSFRVDISVLCSIGREDERHGFGIGEYARDLPKDFNGTVSVGDMRVFEEPDPSIHSQATSIRQFIDTTSAWHHICLQAFLALCCK